METERPTKTNSHGIVSSEPQLWLHSTMSVILPSRTCKYYLINAQFNDFTPELRNIFFININTKHLLNEARIL